MNQDTLLAKIKKDGAAFLSEHPAIKRPLVFTNGCFDLLHAGHVRLLCEASELGATLVVGLNSDLSVRRLKGDTRPLNSWTERAQVLASLFYIHSVVGFSEDTPETLIRMVRPDIHVKGGDYRVEDLPERTAVEESGGRIVILPLLAGFSTTNLIQRMKDG